MKDSILTIPIDDIFENSDGCPFCYMKKTLENKYIDYILGAAMMEPDVRIATNDQGFCKDHFKMMLERKNKLSLALIIQTHLETIKQNIVTPPKMLEVKSKKIDKIRKLNSDCFICSKIDWATSRFMVTFFEMYQKSDDFVKLFNSQKYICLNHYQTLNEMASDKLKKEKLKQFEYDCYNLVSVYLEELYKDVSHFCKMFDYRNAGGNTDWGTSRDSLTRSFDFLCSDNS